MTKKLLWIIFCIIWAIIQAYNGIHSMNTQMQILNFANVILFVFLAIKAIKEIKNS